MTASHFTVPSMAVQVPKGGYGFLAAILDSLDDQDLLAALETPRPYKNAGRRGYGNRGLWRAWLCKYLLQIRYNVDLIERLDNSPKLLDICGLDEAPTGPTLSRFFKRLTALQPLVERVLNQVTDRIHEFLLDLGDALSIDSTVFETYGNPTRKTKRGDPCGDMDARWGYKNSVKTHDKEKIEWCFGYRLHAVADANYGVPLGFIMTPANENDSPYLPRVFDKVCSTHTWMEPQYLIGDKGYDSTKNHTFLMQQGVTPVIHIRRTNRIDESGMHAGIYDEIGTPTCLGGQVMDYAETDPRTGSHVFSCPAEGCHLKDSSKLQNYCMFQTWENPVDQPRVVGKLPRVTDMWKALYKMRWHVERLFGSIKHSRLLEGHCWRGWKKNILHATLSMLTYSATVLTHLRAENKEFRHMRIKVKDRKQVRDERPLMSFQGMWQVLREGPTT